MPPSFKVITGSGDDLLTGGFGGDRFIIGAKDGRDTIADFAPGVDDLAFTAGVRIASVAERDTSSNFRPDTACWSHNTHPPDFLPFHPLTFFTP